MARTPIRPVPAPCTCDYCGERPADMAVQAVNGLPDIMFCEECLERLFHKTVAAERAARTTH